MANSTILVVDDDIVVLTTLSKLLNVFGYIVAGASNSQAAMDYVTNSRKRFDLIITDLAMPGIDGVQFMTEAKKVFPDIPIIVMTGYSERCTPEEALRLGAFAYVVKALQHPRGRQPPSNAPSASAAATASSWHRNPAKTRSAPGSLPDNLGQPPPSRPRAPPDQPQTRSNPSRSSPQHLPLPQPSLNPSNPQPTQPTPGNPSNPSQP